VKTRRKAQRKRTHQEAPEATAEWAEEDGFDGGVVSAVLILGSLGVVMIFSITAPLQDHGVLPPHFLKQASALLAGAALAFGAAAIPLRVWHGIAGPFWAVSVLLLIATFAFGVEANGAKRWLGLPGLGAVFQPAEATKLACVLVVAAVLSHRDGRAEVSRRRMFLALFLALVPAGLLVLQPDLGNAVLTVGLVGLMLFVAGAPLRVLVAPAIIGFIAVGAYVVANPYALHRVEGFLNPWATAHQQGYQLVQSFVAFGRGGIFGVGWGAGLQKLHYLPEAHTDFILAVIAEELGLVGVLVVLGAFAALLVAGIRIALRARQRFAMLTAFGMTALLVVPAVVNGAVVMGLVPTKGLTLPFLSYGRSSAVMSCIAVGLLLRLGREEAKAEARTVGVASPRGLLA
jgi:cell division protein FtsW